LIEYTHEYTKTYRNTYYQVVDVERADQLESHLGTDEFWETKWQDNPGFKEQLQWLADQQEECYDSQETDEHFNGVQLLQADRKYDPSDQDQRYAVERGWLGHYTQHKIDDLDMESPQLITDALKCIKEMDQLERDYYEVKKTQGAQG
jgi:hypothetical protein